MQPSRDTSAPPRSSQGDCPPPDTLTPVDTTMIRKTGYIPEDLLKAPLEPPQTKRACKPNRRQSISIILSLILAAVGIALWPVLGFVVSVACMGAASVFIALSTLVRV